MEKSVRIVASIASAIALAGCSFLLNGDFAGEELPAEAGASGDAGGAGDGNGGSDASGGGDAPSDARDGGLDPSLVALWTFDDASSSVIADETGKGHDLVLAGAQVTPTGGVRGGALVLGELATAKAASLSTSKFPTKGTLSFWFKYTWADNDTAGRGIFDDWDKTRSHLFVRRAPNEPSGRLQVAMQKPTTAGDYAWVQGFDTTRDKWTHVVLTWDPSASTAALYADGNVVKSGSYDQYPGTSPTDQDFGFGNSFVGSIDEIAIYDRVLTPVEALMLP